MIEVRVNGRPCPVPEGSTVAAAIARADVVAFRRSVHGRPRAPLCGMGVCFECRVTIDGRPQSLACQTPCRDGMEVATE